MPSITKLICPNCQIEFLKPTKEITRQLKRKSTVRFFCSLSCTSILANKNIERKQAASIRMKQLRLANPEKFVNHSGKKQKGKFTYYLNKMRSRSKRKGFEYDLDEEFLQTIWNNQEGKCALTGIELILRTTNSTRCPTAASLDRIDSKLGYIKNNVQFLALSVNYAKSDFSDEEFKEFLFSINTRWQGWTITHKEQRLKNSVAT